MLILELFLQVAPWRCVKLTVSHKEWVFPPENIALGYNIPPKLVDTHGNKFPVKIFFKSVDEARSVDFPGPKSAKIVLLLAKLATRVHMKTLNCHQKSNSRKLDLTIFLRIISKNVSPYF